MTPNSIAHLRHARALVSFARQERSTDEGVAEMLLQIEDSILRVIPLDKEENSEPSAN